MRGRVLGQISRFFLLSLLAFLFIVSGCGSGSGSQKLQFQTEYQAVFLANGQAFFGKAEVGQDYVTLKDVFFIQRQVNPEDSKQVRNVLVKKAQEPHAPGVTYINRAHVLLIEPVSSDSQVAKLIKDAAAQKPAGTQ